jgi:diaminopimelate epimerase
MLYFTKMHSLGNDFVIIDAINQNVALNVEHLVALADRHLGIGCDQIILLQPSVKPQTDFYYSIYNNNGTIAEQCINGIRCAAKFAVEHGLVKKNFVTADCMSGKINVLVEGNIVTAILNNFDVPVSKIFLDLKTTSLINFDMYSLSIGNPHAIVIINPDLDLANNHPANNQHIQDLSDHQYAILANKIAKHPLFAVNGVNVGFARIIDSNIDLRVFERGVGETLSCGSNAVAAFLVAKHIDPTLKESLVLFRLGSLKIRLNDNSLEVSGRVNHVFDGRCGI